MAIVDKWLIVKDIPCDGPSDVCLQENNEVIDENLDETADWKTYTNEEYGFLDEYYKDSFEKIITPYNLLRNYLTKKPWESVQKWKLNFENSTLAGGWDKNKETDNWNITGLPGFGSQGK